MTHARYNPQWTAAVNRMVTRHRRPEDAVLVREAITDALTHVGTDDMRPHPRTLNAYPTTMSSPVIRQYQQSNDLYAREMLNQRDTVVLFAGPQFCELIAATDAPPVMDLSILSPVGNHTVVVTFAKNMTTTVAGDALIGMMLHLSEPMDDGHARLLGALLHEDLSETTFLYPVTPVGPDLYRVSWETGLSVRTDYDSTTEQRLMMNTMGLLAAQSVTEVTEWNHYSRTARGEAKRAKRKLPPVNVITLAARSQRNLDEHHEAVTVERDGWWPVRGHFRLAKVGPGRSSQRLTYVHPCRRGNLSGPNIGRAQVKQTA